MNPPDVNVAYSLCRHPAGLTTDSIAFNVTMDDFVLFKNGAIRSGNLPNYQ